MSTGKPRLGPKRSRQLRALNASIPHWDAIVARDPDHAPEAGECALCDEYADRCNLNMNGCAGCPISEHTGESGCQNSPYHEAEREFHSDEEGTAPTVKRAKMRDFLVMLRDKITIAP